MEALLLMAGALVALIVFGKLTGQTANRPAAPPGTAPDSQRVGTGEPVPAAQPVFVRMETVTVSRPDELADAIDRVVRDRTNNFFNTNYIVGTPQVSSDGLTANVPLYRQD